MSRSHVVDSPFKFKHDNYDLQKREDKSIEDFTLRQNQPVEKESQSFHPSDFHIRNHS